MTTETTGASAPEGTDADTTPAFRYNGALASEIERRWRDYWDEHDTFATPNPVGPLAQPSTPNAGARSCSSTTCSRTRPVTASTWGTCWATPAPTCTPASSG